MPSSLRHLRRALGVLALAIAAMGALPAAASAAYDLQVAFGATTATRTTGVGSATYTSSALGGTVSYSDLMTDLLTRDVLLQNGAGGVEPGTITIATNINAGSPTWGGTVTIDATSDVVFNADFQIGGILDVDTPTHVVINTTELYAGNQTWRAPVEITDNTDLIHGSGDIDFLDTVDIDGPLEINVASGRQGRFAASVTNVGGGGSINKTGSGRLEFEGTNTYTGGTTITDGIVVLTGDDAGNITVAGELRGEGATNGAVTVSSVGTLRPGSDGSQPNGLLTASSFTLTAGSTYAVSIDDTDYTRASAPTVTLGGATLSIALADRPPVGTTRTILNNMHVSNPTSGTFAGLVQGSSITIGGTVFRISYTGGTGNDVTLERIPFTPTVNSPATTPTTDGALASFSATVTGDNPSGNARVYVDGNDAGVVALAAGVASYSTAALAVGEHTIVFDYLGDTDNYSRTGNAVTHTVTAHATTTSLARSETATSLGASLTLKATVAGGGATPTGTVTFRDGTDVIGTVAVGGDGVAQLVTSALTLGTHSISATYGGDATHAASVDTVSHVVSVAATTTTLTQARTLTVSGGEFELKAVVTSAAGTPTGTVTFLDGTRTIATRTVGAGGITKLTTSSTTRGRHAYRARFNATGSFGESTSDVASHQVIPTFLTLLRISPGCLATATTPTTVRYRVGARSTVTFAVQRQTRPAAAAPRTCPRANPVTGGVSNTGTRFSQVATRSVTVGTGTRRMEMATILGRRTLSPGRYVLTITATRADGLPAVPTRLGFVVLRS